jgi:hypothetical protein
MHEGAKYDGTPRCVTPRADGVKRMPDDDGGCALPPLELDPRSAAVLDFFEACMDQYPPSFDGARYGLPAQSVEAKARIHGIELSEWWDDKLRVCAGVIREQDVANIKAKQDAGKR